MKVKLNNVRLAFPTLFEAKQVNGEGDPTFGATFIFEPTHPAVKDINDAIDQVAKEKWADKSPSVLKACKAGLKICLKEGDLKPEYEGFPGNMFLSANNKARPLVIDRDKSPLALVDGRPYAGCYVNAAIDIWAMDNKFGKRICASLMGVQFFGDGDAFGGGGIADANDFDNIEEGTDADLL